MRVPTLLTTQAYLTLGYSLLIPVNILQKSTEQLDVLQVHDNFKYTVFCAAQGVLLFHGRIFTLQLLPHQSRNI